MLLMHKHACTFKVLVKEWNEVAVHFPRALVSVKLNIINGYSKFIICLVYLIVIAKCAAI